MLDSQNNENILKQIEELKKQLPKKERKSKKLPVAISEEEFIELIKATKKKEHKLAYLLGFGSGLRISEIVALEPRHIRNDGQILIELGKGSKDRIVPTPKGFREEYLKLLPLKIGARALEKSFKSACVRAGILTAKPSLHFHSLRHGFATNCIKNGMKIHNLRTLMGHSNIATTNVYLEANPQDAIKEYQALF